MLLIKWFARSKSKREKTKNHPSYVFVQEFFKGTFLLFLEKKNPILGDINQVVKTVCNIFY